MEFAAQALALSLALAGHLDPLAGRDPFVVDGAFVGGATSWGLVLRDDDGRFRRVCEEAAGGPALLAHRAADGSVLVATGAGLLVTRDAGCSFASVDGMLAALEVTALAGAADGSALYAATGRLGAPNGVWRSGDGGLSFADTALAGVIHPLLELAVDDAGAVVAVSGSDVDEERPLLRLSLDGGASFHHLGAPGADGGAPAVDLDAWVRVRVLAVVAGRVWLTLFDHAQRASLGSLDVAGAVDDGSGGGAVAVLRVEGDFGADHDVTALAALDGDVFALVRPGALHRRALAAGPESWQLVDGVTLSCLRRLPGDVGLHRRARPVRALERRRGVDAGARRRRRRSARLRARHRRRRRLPGVHAAGCAR